MRLIKIIFKIIFWIFKKIFGIKSKSSDKRSKKATKVEKQTPTKDYIEIGSIERRDNWLSVSDTIGKMLYKGNGGEGEEWRMVYSSKMIVFQNGNRVSVFAIYNDNYNYIFRRIYSGNALNNSDPIVSASEFSFFTEGRGTSKYTIDTKDPNGSCKTEYTGKYN